MNEVSLPNGILVQYGANVQTQVVVSIPTKDEAVHDSGFWTFFASGCSLPSLLLISQSNASMLAKQEQEIWFDLLPIHESPLNALP